jgi:hypothetical protein
MTVDLSDYLDGASLGASLDDRPFAVAIEPYAKTYDKSREWGANEHLLPHGRMPTP